MAHFENHFAKLCRLLIIFNFYLFIQLEQLAIWLTTNYNRFNRKNIKKLKKNSRKFRSCNQVLTNLKVHNLLDFWILFYFVLRNQLLVVVH